MRKFFILLLTFFCFADGYAQVSEADKNAAIQSVTSNMKVLSLAADDLNNLVVSNSYLDDITGIRYVYLIQTYKDVQIYNQMQVLSFKNDKLLSQSGGRINMPEQRVNVSNGKPVLTAVSAVSAALFNRKITGAANALVINSTDNGQKIEFNKMGVSLENITAKLIWFPVADGKTMRLAWQVFIASASTPDYWLVNVDAVNSEILGVDNLTVYDSWGTPTQDDIDAPPVSPETNVQIKFSDKTFDFTSGIQLRNSPANSPSIVNAASYRVIPFPAESPQVSGGTAAIRTDPWLAAPGNATTLKWHTGLLSANYNYTRGNNVWAYQDRTTPTNTGTIAKSASSTTSPDPLTFDFVPNFTVDPIQSSPVQNQQFAITNLFYWNNIVHDIMYQYGFTEAAANFQDDNQSRGGAGNDHVNAEAQDGSGTNNANFSTPADGSSGRMQMYIFNLNSPSPSKDGDLDNGIVVHEFGHGISNRLTGGGVATCLTGGAETGGMGEGWSDYFALMIHQNWATSNLNTGFTTPRPMGMYALSNVNLFAASPPNSGIRNYPYCTNMSVNPLTYASLGVSPIGTAVHNIGEVWCATLWDMTWNIIQQENAINPNIYNLAGGGGNTIAMKLVTEGMKLQPCGPGFIDARNAILQADINLYGGAHTCAIKEAFRRRGMGEGASQGLPTSATDQVVSFTGAGELLTLLQNGIISTPEGQNINYTNRLTTCGPISNYTISDTLPANVSFVSATAGGSYNVSNRVLSWVVNQAASSTLDYNFVVSINAGAYYPTITVLDEPVLGSTIPASWSATSTTTTQWVVTSAQSKSPAYSFFGANLPSVSDQKLTTTNSFSLPASPPNLSFWHYYNSEYGYDGGVVEISINGGTTWADIGAANFILNGYNSTLNTCCTNPLPGRLGFSGNSSGFIRSLVNLAPYANQSNVKLRWRFGSDITVAVNGWYVDDINISNVARVDMRSSLFNASNVRTGFSDSIMIITAPPQPPPSPTASFVQPTCATSTGSITVTAPTGSGYTYSIGAGYQASSLFSNVAPGTYLVTVSANSLPSPATSVTINSQPVIPATPAAVQGFSNVCPYVGTGNQLTYAVPETTGATSYTWTVPPTVTVISGQGTSSILVTIDNGFVSNANKLIKVAANSTCGTSGDRLFYLLAQYPTTASPITASSNDVCQSLGTGLPITFSIPSVPSATSYIWTAQPGTTVITNAPGSGVGDTTVTVTFTSGFSSSFIKVTAVNECGVSGTRSLLISRLNPSIPSLISGPINACDYILPGGLPATYSVPQGENITSYTWTVPAGAIGLMGQGTNSVSFLFPSTFSGGSVSVYAENGCGVGDSRSLSISRLNAATPGRIDVINTAFCPDRQYSYTVASLPSNSTSLLWTIPTDATILSGQGSTSILVSYPLTSINGTVTVTSLNNCGSSVTRAVTIKIPACPPPGFTRNPGQQPKNINVITAGTNENMNVDLFPNPTHDNFRLRFHSLGKEIINVRILDIQAREIKRMIINPNEIKYLGYELKPRVYLIEIMQGNGRIVKKLIKI